MPVAVFPALFFLLYFVVVILLALYSFSSLHKIYNFVSKRVLGFFGTSKNDFKILRSTRVFFSLFFY